MNRAPRLRRKLLVTVCVIALAAIARADTYLLKNGNRLRGGKPEAYSVGKTKWLRVGTAFGNVRFRQADLKRRLKTTAGDGPLRVEEIITTLVRGKVEKSRDGETWTLVEWPKRGLTSDRDEAHLPVNEPNRFIAPGDHVRTGADGVLDLDIGWGVVHVAPESEIVFEEKTSASLRVLKGRAGTDVPALPADGEFRVETPQSSMGVRGTRFCVSVGAATRVAVAEGTVDVAGVRVVADQAVEQIAGGDPSLDSIDSEEEALLERTRRAYAAPHFDWVQIPAGKYVMGEKNGSAGHGGESATWPEHTVRLTAFELGRVEVTNAQYMIWIRWLDEHRDHTFCHPNERQGIDHRPWKSMTGEEAPEWFHADDLPVSGISWYSAYGFAAWSGVHLPSEAQWEYVARAGTRKSFPWGDTVDGYEKYAWWEMNVVGGAYHPQRPPAPLRAHGPEYDEWVARARREAQAGPRPVGTLAPNRWGVHDLMGNVGEYLRDFMHLDYEGAPADGSPWLSMERVAMTDGAPARVGRGESWRLMASDYTPLWARSPRPAGRSEVMFGLRVMRPIRR